MLEWQKGFTLFELLMVFAIIGVLAALTVSAYQTHTVRAQVAEALDIAAPTMVLVADTFHNDEQPPANRVAAGLTRPPGDTKGRYVSRLDINDGRIDVTFGNEVHQDIFGAVISFTPYLSAPGNIVWRCGAAPAPAGTVLLTGGGVTTAYRAPALETRYLPRGCRR